MNSEARIALINILWELVYQIRELPGLPENWERTMIRTIEQLERALS